MLPQIPNPMPPVAPVPPKTSNTPYIFAVVAIVFFGVAGAVTIICLRPEADVIVVIAGVFAVLTPTLISTMALMKGQEAVVTTQGVHYLVNSQMDTYKKALEELSNARVALERAAGINEGMQIANKRTDALQEHKQPPIESE